MAKNNEADKNKGWGTKHARADREVRKTTSQMDKDANNGKGIVRGSAIERGEALTRRADLAEAAKIARNNGGH